MFRSYKCRIYPNESQRVMFMKHFGACRFVYNLALETKITAYRSTGKNLSGYELNKQLTALKEDAIWLQEVNAQSLQNSIFTLDRSFERFFSGSGFPKFKSKRARQSFVCAQGCRINYATNELKIPKVHGIKFRGLRVFTGNIKTVTISRTSTNKFFASILVDNHIGIPEKCAVDPDKTIGIDLGLKDFAITSEGIRYENPKNLSRSISKLKYLERQASKKAIGSANHAKSKYKISCVHERIVNRRTDYLQKLSHKLVSDNQTTTFCMESLRVGNMVKNHNLAQAIYDVSWSRFKEMIRYKCLWTGKNIVEIGSFEPSSKKCSSCKSIKDSLTLSEREWTCANCGTTHDRDVNAAINIKLIGLNVGKQSRRKPVELPKLFGAKKQEKLRTPKVQGLNAEQKQRTNPLLSNQAKG